MDYYTALKMNVQCYTTAVLVDFKSNVERINSSSVIPCAFPTQTNLEGMRGRGGGRERGEGKEGGNTSREITRVG